MGRLLRRIVLLLVVLGLAAATAFMLWPRPVEVETATIVRGPMQVTVDEDGRTRIKEKYIVSAPLQGRMARVSLREGDPVVAGETVVASIEPMDPALLDPRAQAQAQARVGAAEAALEAAAASVQRAGAAMELAQTELARVREAQAVSAAAQQEIDRAQATEAMRREEYRAAEFERQIAEFELELARAALLRSTPGGDQAEWRLDITAPVDGRVLRVIQESAAVVQAGAPLIEIGDPTDLELVVDVLSSDGVAITPGAEALIEQWGGEQPLHGRVRLVEPAAFTKISALGVEEQRVNVIIDLVDPREAWQGLGDGYRIEARIVIWSDEQALKAPAGALFRHAQSWAVFAIEDGRVVTRDIQVGRRNALEAQVLSGLDEGDTVVVYPGDLLRDGLRVTPRD